MVAFKALLAPRQYGLAHELALREVSARRDFHTIGKPIDELSWFDSTKATIHKFFRGLTGISTFNDHVVDIRN